MRMQPGVPKPLPGMKVRSGIKNCNTKQNLSPKSEYLDLFQLNGHIFKDKPSSIISSMLTQRKKKKVFRNTKLLRTKIQKFSASLSHFLLSKEPDTFEASTPCEDLRPRSSGTSSLTDNGKS